MRVDYLAIPRKYGHSLGGLQWSAQEDAIECNGRTFAMVGQIRHFLEGFTACRPLIHFGHVLHFLYLLREGHTVRHDFTILAEAWRAAGRPGRTAGVLAATLCRTVPSVPSVPVHDVVATVFSVRMYHSGMVSLDEPPLDPEVFEAVLAAELQGWEFDELLHWFRQGRPALEFQGRELAGEVLARKPRSLARALAEASQHHRLTGAVPFVSRLVGMLTLPPRRSEASELSLGGYSDVTTRGQPEQILPGQFALDEVEFLRRHVAHELLHYRREEPAVRTVEEMIVLFDQGVRTWGSVRLLLAACVFALGELASERRMGLRVATTATTGPLVDPRAFSAGELGELLAASDLSLSPGLALETLLGAERPGGTAGRDFVLLTHPRSLASSEVASAARRLQRGDRLFAVTVAGTGEVGYHEVLRGQPVLREQFRLDLDVPATTSRGQRTSTSPVVANLEIQSSWSGDVDRIGFPFRFGLSSCQEQLLFAFDRAGEWLLAAGSSGCLVGVRVDGTGFEMLPRAVVGGELLADVHEVIGVEGGFVVVGTTQDTGELPGAPQRLAAAHYQLSGRTCRVFEFRLPRSIDREWRYFPHQHCLAVRIRDRFWWVHLPTGKSDGPFPEQFQWPPPEPPSRERFPLPWQENDPSGGTGAPQRPVLVFDCGRGVLALEGVHPDWQAFRPVANGETVLAGLTLTRAECREDTLAVLFTRSDYRKDLWLFAGPDGAWGASLPLPYEHDSFHLSTDGRWLAVQRGAGQVQVREVGPGLSIRAVTPVGRFHNNLVAELGEQILVLSIDRIVHTLSWRGGELAISHTHPGHAGLVRALPGRIPGFLSHDRGRFRLAAWSHLVAVVSSFGEVFLFEPTGELVCGFFVFREQIAAWLPDGTCLGPEVLLAQGSSPAPDAARRMGQALATAWERGERTVR